MKKYGVEVVNFIPGSQVLSTAIMERHSHYMNEMSSAFSDEQLDFYGDYYDRYNNYIKQMSGTKPVQIIDDANLLLTFRNAILDYTPHAMYICEPLRY